MKQYCECGRIVENPDTKLCATCAHLRRKAERFSEHPQKIHILPKVSPREAKRLKTYTQLRIEHLKKHPGCQIKLSGCLGKATEIHHTAKRGANLINSASFLSACHTCHAQVETSMSAKERRERGFLKS